MSNLNDFYGQIKGIAEYTKRAARDAIGQSILKNAAKRKVSFMMVIPRPSPPLSLLGSLSRRRRNGPCIARACCRHFAAAAARRTADVTSGKRILPTSVSDLGITISLLREPPVVLQQQRSTTVALGIVAIRRGQNKRRARREDLARV